MKVQLLRIKVIRLICGCPGDGAAQVQLNLQKAGTYVISGKSDGANQVDAGDSRRCPYCFRWRYHDKYKCSNQRHKSWSCLSDIKMALQTHFLIQVLIVMKMRCCDFFLKEIWPLTVQLLLTLMPRKITVLKPMTAFIWLVVPIKDYLSWCLQCQWWTQHHGNNHDHWGWGRCC